eukprot:GHVQ01004428.1.p1 GENE.GHVQ01004428.1~~GHVQ01004428.1.p1  ORF type:complete len:439 (+),score=75.16 GHVQ01004428.1:318-1634(+)
MQGGGKEEGGREEVRELVGNCWRECGGDRVEVSLRQLLDVIRYRTVNKYAQGLLRHASTPLASDGCAAGGDRGGVARVCVCVPDSADYVAEIAIQVTCQGGGKNLRRLTAQTSGDTIRWTRPLKSLSRKELSLFHHFIFTRAQGPTQTHTHTLLQPLNLRPADTLHEDNAHVPAPSSSVLASSSHDSATPGLSRTACMGRLLTQPQFNLLRRIFHYITPAPPSPHVNPHPSALLSAPVFASGTDSSALVCPSSDPAATLRPMFSMGASPFSEFIRLLQEDKYSTVSIVNRTVDKLKLCVQQQYHTNEPQAYNMSAPRDLLLTTQRSCDVNKLDELNASMDGCCRNIGRLVGGTTGEGSGGGLSCCVLCLGERDEPERVQVAQKWSHSQKEILGRCDKFFPLSIYECLCYRCCRLVSWKPPLTNLILSFFGRQSTAVIA